ncbi:dimethylargininase [Mycobacterium sp. 155]|uniref:dimethylargininase n=1 Tax=Mycobacterium sp. 155 TaxID=1157943 RepID=UPI000A2F8A48|nr:dimethylargininase [Mycobacterium sp. 155]
MTTLGEVIPVSDATTSTPRRAITRSYAMTEPRYFAVEYAINPWMDTSTPVDPQRAVNQWDALRRTYLDLGHAVDLVPPRPGLPDMVYAANGGIVVGDAAVVAKFAYPQRAAEADAYADWMTSRGLTPVRTGHINEGQGDFLLVGSTLLAGWGFRTERDAHEEVATITGLSVVSLELVDPRFYHLDTALAVLDNTTIAYYPAAFTDAGRCRITELFPDAIEVTTADANVLGLNVVSDGRHVVMPSTATGFAEQLRSAGFEPIGVDLSELLKGGGSVKCCTLELHP